MSNPFSFRIVILMALAASHTAAKVPPRIQFDHVWIPLGFPTYYRALLFIASEGVLFGTIAYGYMKEGPGWLLVGWPFGLVAAFIVQGVILRAFPPKLEPHAVGNIWLKLS